jgi:hypothetical protein
MVALPVEPPGDQPWKPPPAGGLAAREKIRIWRSNTGAEVRWRVFG